MKIVAIGCTGQSGQKVVEQAIERGHEVVGICRSPEKMKFKHERFTAVKASIFNADELAPHFEDADAIISLLGFLRMCDCCSTIDGYERAEEQIMLAMQKSGMKGRLMLMHSWWSDPSSRSCCAWSDCTCIPNCRCFMYWQMRCCIIPLFLRHTFNGMHRAEVLCQEDRFSDIDYVVMKPPSLDHIGTGNSQSVTTKDIYAEEGNSVGSGYPALSRGDCARWFLDNLDNQELSRKMVATRYKEDLTCG